MGLGRVELPTYGLGNRRSIHLSYSPVEAILSELRWIFSGRPRDRAPHAAPVAGKYIQNMVKQEGCGSDGSHSNRSAT